MMTGIAFNIPDFEGQAILRIFSSSTQSEIACYAAAVTNGATVNQQASVGTILGLFSLLALVLSISTAVYGSDVSEMRTHYAHSLSMLVVFAVFHHIYFTGALSMNWPSILVAFWANYAWTAGMISVPSMQNAISQFTGDSGSTLILGAATNGGDASGVADGYRIGDIYQRQTITAHLLSRLAQPKWIDSFGSIASRNLPSYFTGYKWYGPEASAGLPLPGNYSGFAGTLSEEMIPASNAFLTGLIWLLVLLGIVATSIGLFKLVLELLSRTKLLKQDRLVFFRANWKRYIAFALLRGCFISFFMMIFLTVFQFTYGGHTGVIAIAALTFVLILAGMLGVASYAMYIRLRPGTWRFESERIMLQRTTVLRFIPWYSPRLESKIAESEKIYAATLAFKKLTWDAPENEVPIHEDTAYILQYGWLVSRFRRSRWWFFALWLIYESVRAFVFAGASGHPLVQVFFLLIIEFVAFIFMIRLRPFEGQRLNMLMVYLLGFSKVLTVALSAAFYVNFNIGRIAATVVGAIIIAIQVLLTIALLVCIILSGISTYFSVTRNRASIKPKRWMDYRARYLAHIDQTATDQPVARSESRSSITDLGPIKPSFLVGSVRRVPKIEDHDEDFQKEISFDPRSPVSQSNSYLLHASTRSLLRTPDGKWMAHKASVAHSLSSNMSHSSLPYAAALHRGNWTTPQFAAYQAERDSMAERFVKGGDLVSQRSGSALSPQLHHLSSRDSFTDSSSRASSSRETSWASKRPLSKVMPQVSIDEDIILAEPPDSINTIERHNTSDSEGKALTSNFNRIECSSPPGRPAKSKRLSSLSKGESIYEEESGIDEGN
jgi:Transient receptor potential (TRP) ion channel/ML-like domain